MRVAASVSSGNEKAAVPGEAAAARTTAGRRRVRCTRRRGPSARGTLPIFTSEQTGCRTTVRGASPQRERRARRSCGSSRPHRRPASARRVPGCPSLRPSRVRQRIRARAGVDDDGQRTLLRGVPQLPDRRVRGNRLRLAVSLRSERHAAARVSMPLGMCSCHAGARGDRDHRRRGPSRSVDSPGSAPDRPADAGREEDGRRAGRLAFPAGRPRAAGDRRRSGGTRPAARRRSGPATLARAQRRR